MGVYDGLLRVVASNKDYYQDGRGPVKSQILEYALVGHPRVNVALDQSTSQIGVAVADAETDELLCIMDLCNLGFPDKFEFKHCFLDFMRNNIEGLSIEHFFYEIPVEHARNMYSRRVLNDLMSFIEEMPHYVQSLKQAQMHAVNNLVWKTHFLADPAYKGRRKRTEDVKYSAQEEALKRFPWIGMHQNLFSKPADSCDAIGILYGAFEEMRSPSLGRSFIQINKLMENGPRVKTLNYTDAIDVQEIPERIKRYFFEQPYVIAEFNPGMSIEDNINRWCRNDNRPVCMLVLQPKAEQIVRWESKISRHEGQYYAVFAQRVV